MGKIPPYTTAGIKKAIAESRMLCWAHRKARKNGRACRIQV
jgi:hypothetical protein